MTNEPEATTVVLDVDASALPDASKDHTMSSPMIGAPRFEFAGGALTWSEYDDWKGAAKIDQAVNEVQVAHQGLIANITSDDDLSASEKARRMTAASTELSRRIQAAEAAAAAGSSHLDEDNFRALDEGEKQETKRVDGANLGRSDFADRGDADTPSTWKLPLTRTPGGVDAGRIRDAITALQPGGFRGQTVSLSDSRSTVIGRIRSAVGRLPNEADRERLRGRLTSLRGARALNGGATAVFKDQATGNWRWMAIHSNRYYDREDEVFPEDAHKDYVDWVQRTKMMPTLRLWHIPHNIGRADWVDYTDGFVISSGTFDAGYEDVAESLSQQKGLLCSHGFNYNPREVIDGAYTKYRTFEVSVLPEEAAANALTAFVADEEIPMITKERRGFMVEHMGEGRVAALEQELEEMKAVAERQGISFKSMIDGLQDEAPATATKDDVTAPPAAPPTPEAPAEPVATAPPEEKEEEEGAEPASAAPAAAAPDADPSLPPAATSTATPDGDVPPEADAGKSALTFADLINAISNVNDQVKLIAEANKALAEQVTTLTATRDSDIAKLIRPRVGPTDATPASQSEGNIVSPEVTEAVRAIAGNTEGSDKPATAAAATPYADAMAHAMGGGNGTVPESAGQ